MHQKAMWNIFKYISCKEITVENCWDEEISHISSPYIELEMENAAEITNIYKQIFPIQNYIISGASIIISWFFHQKMPER